MNLLIWVSISTILCSYCLAIDFLQIPENTKSFRTNNVSKNGYRKQTGSFQIPYVERDQIPSKPNRLNMKQFPPKYNEIKQNSNYRQVHQRTHPPLFEKDSSLTPRPTHLDSKFPSFGDSNRKVELSQETFGNPKEVDKFFENFLNQFQFPPNYNGMKQNNNYRKVHQRTHPPLFDKEMNQNSSLTPRPTHSDSKFPSFGDSNSKAFRPDLSLPFPQSILNNAADISHVKKMHKLSPQSKDVESGTTKQSKKNSHHKKYQNTRHHHHLHRNDLDEKNSHTVELDFSEANATDMYSELLRTLVEVLPTRPNFQKVNKLKLIVKPPEEGNTTFIRDFMTSLKNITTVLIPDALIGAKLTAFKKDNDTLVIFQVTLYVKYLREMNDKKLPQSNNSSQIFKKEYLNDNNTEAINLIADETVDIEKINLANITSNYKVSLNSILFQLLENSSRLHEDNESSLLILISLPYQVSFELTDRILKIAQSAICEFAPEISPFVKYKLLNGKDAHAPRIEIEIPIQRINHTNNLEILNLTNTYEDRYMEISSKVSRILYEKTKCQSESSTLKFNLTIILPKNERNHSIQQILREVTNILREFVPHHRIYVESQTASIDDCLVLELSITMRSSKVLTYHEDREKRISINLQKPGSHVIQKIRKVLPVIVREIKESSIPVSIIFNVSFPLGINKKLIRSEIFSLITLIENAIPLKDGSIANVIFQITVIPTNMSRKNKIMRSLKFSEYKNHRPEMTTTESKIFVKQTSLSESNSESSFSEEISQPTTEESSTLYYVPTQIHELVRVPSALLIRPKINFTKITAASSTDSSNTEQISENQQKIIVPYQVSTSRYENSELFSTTNEQQRPLQFAQSTIMNEEKTEKTTGPLTSFFRFLNKKYHNIKKLPHNLRKKIKESIHTRRQTPFSKKHIKKIVSRRRWPTIENKTTNRRVFENEAISSPSSNLVNKLNVSEEISTENIHTLQQTPFNKGNIKKIVSKIAWPSVRNRATRTTIFENEASSTHPSNFVEKSNESEEISTTPSIFEQLMARNVEPFRNLYSPIIPYHLSQHPTPFSRDNIKKIVSKKRWPRVRNRATRTSIFENEASSTLSSNLIENSYESEEFSTTPSIIEQLMATNVEPSRNLYSPIIPYHFSQYRTEIPENIHTIRQTPLSEGNFKRYGIFEKLMARNVTPSPSLYSRIFHYLFNRHQTTTPANINTGWRTTSSNENNNNGWRTTTSYENNNNGWRTTSRNKNKNNGWRTTSSNKNNNNGWGTTSSNKNINTGWPTTSSNENNNNGWRTTSSYENNNNGWRTTSSYENNNNGWRTTSNDKYINTGWRTTSSNKNNNNGWRTTSSNENNNNGWRTTSSNENIRNIVSKIKWPSIINRAINENLFQKETNITPTSNLVDESKELEEISTPPVIFANRMAEIIEPSRNYLNDETSTTKELFGSFSTTPSSEINNISNTEVYTSVSVLNGSVENTYQTLTTPSSEIKNISNTEVYTSASVLNGSVENTNQTLTTQVPLIENQTNPYEQRRTTQSSRRWEVSEKAFTEFSAYNTTNMAKSNNSRDQSNSFTSDFEKTPVSLRTKSETNENLKVVTEPNVVTNHALKGLPSTNEQILEKTTSFPSIERLTTKFTSENIERPVKEYHSQNSIDDNIASSSSTKEIIEKESSAQYYENNGSNIEKRTLNLSELKSAKVNEIEKLILSEVRPYLFEENKPTVFLFKIIPPEGMMVHELRSFTEPLLSLLISDLPNSEISITTRAYYNEHKEIKLMRMKITLYVSTNKAKKNGHPILEKDEKEERSFRLYLNLITHKILEHIHRNISYDQTMQFNIPIVHPEIFTKTFSSELIKSLEEILSRILPYENVNITYSSTETNSSLILTLVNVIVAPSSKSGGMTWSPLLHMDMSFSELKNEISHFIFKNVLGNTKSDQNIIEVINFVFDTNKASTSDIIGLTNSISKILNEMGISEKFLYYNARLKFNREGKIIIELPFSISTTRKSLITYVINSYRDSVAKKQQILPEASVSDLLLED